MVFRFDLAAGRISWLTICQSAPHALARAQAPALSDGSPVLPGSGGHI
jgi:hypothetical protein